MDNWFRYNQLPISCCLRLCKDTKIKANHNSLKFHAIGYMLSKTLQRYENKSKSQHKKPAPPTNRGCLRLCKDTKIKANHNWKGFDPFFLQLSKTLQRYENKSKSQHQDFTYIQRYVV